MTTKFRAAHVVAMDDAMSVYSPGAVVFDGPQLLYVGSADGHHDPVDKEIEVPEGIIIPGLLNGHNHAAMSLMRGLTDDSPFFEWLTQHIWPVESRLTAEDIKIGVMLAQAEMLHSGTVGFADMYFEVDACAEAVEQAGMRAWISRGLDQPSAEKLQASLEFCRHWSGKAGGRIQTMLGPHAPYTCPPDYLAEIAAAAADRGIGILRSLCRCAAYAALLDEGKALTDGVSRHGPDSNHGHGFRPIFTSLMNLHGELRFRSGDHAIVMDGASPALATSRITQKAPIDGFFASVRWHAALR